MMAAWIVLLLAQDPAAAGAAYRDGLHAFERGRPDVAAAKFQLALEHLDEETPALYFRDREGRHRLAYYPRYMLARALLAQERVPEAVVHLERSQHPGAEAALRDALARLDPSAPAESPVRAALRRRVEELCEAGRFEDALRTADADPALSDRVRVRRAQAVEPRARALAEALERLEDLDPLRQPEAIADLLRPARVPPSMQALPDPPLRWARRFGELVEREAPRLRRAATLPVEQSLATAAAFGASAKEARDAGCPRGVLAAIRAAHAVRLARLEAPSTTEAEARVLLDAAEASVRDATALGVPERDVRAFAERVAARRRGNEALSVELARAREAAEALEDPARMADPAALADAASRIEAIGPVPDAVRARLAVRRALLEASRLFLEGETDAAVAARCGPAIAEALALDPAAAEAFEGLSPRLRALQPAAK